MWYNYISLVKKRRKGIEDLGFPRQRDDDQLLFSLRRSAGEGQLRRDRSGRRCESARKLEAKELTPEYFLLTHGHFDHIMGLEPSEDFIPTQNTYPQR